jgi:hypothetical protein
MACGNALKTSPGLQPDRGQFNQNNPKPADHWRILATTLIKARLLGQKTVRIRGVNSVGAHLISEYPQVDIAKVQAVLNTVRLASSKGDLSGRTLSEFGVLVRAARRLEVLLKAVEPPAGQPGPGSMPGGTGAAENGTGEAGEALGAGSDRIPGYHQEATEQDGVAAGGAGDAVNAPAQGSPGSGSGGGYVTTGYERFDPGTFNTCLPAIKRVAQRIATDGDAINSEGGYSSGNSLADPVHAVTDGMCMGRWIIDSHADGMAVAVLLDCSGSMINLSAVAGVAEAFASGMEECAEVNRWTFSDPDELRNLQTFRHTLNGGSTATDTGLQAAKDWLTTQEAGQKVVICITDGEPNTSSEEPTKTITRELIQAGVKVIGVALGGIQMQMDISKSMPGAKVVQAEDANRLAIQLESLSLTM